MVITFPSWVGCHVTVRHMGASPAFGTAAHTCFSGTSWRSGGFAKSERDMNLLSNSCFHIFCINITNHGA